MKVALVNPNFGDHRSRDAMEPLAFAVLRSLTPPDVDTVLLDERVEDIDFDVHCDAVAISVQTFTARRAYEIAADFRRRGVPVILGGCHPSLVPDEAAEFCDCVVVGEAEATWPAVVQDLKTGSLRTRYAQNGRRPPHAVPDRSVFDGKRYSRLVPVRFGTGCRYSCDFCSAPIMYGGTVNQRPVDSILKEIDSIRSRYLLFVDDNILLNRDNTRELFRSLKQKDRKWVCQISIDAAFDDELVATMADSGCMAVFVGLESLNAANLEQIGKVSNLKYNEYPEAIRRFRRNGIMFCGSFVFGYDDDTEETIRSAYEFAMESRLCIAHFNTLFPMPGTRLYQRLEAEGRLRFDRWWLDPDFRYGQGLFRPTRITADRLGEMCYRMRLKFNSVGHILYRLADHRANSHGLVNTAAFLAANIISRKEIRRKQHRPLGAGQ